MTKKRIKMSTPAEVRAAISKVSNMVLNGEIDNRTANTIIYACNTQLGAIRTDVQQAKLEELEKLMEGLKDE